jgi:hypothetical protein
MEEKVDINPYQGEIDALKLNYWLQQLEVYFSVHDIDEEHRISFARLKLEWPCFNLMGKPYKNT